MIRKSILAGTLIAFGCLFSMSVVSVAGGVAFTWLRGE